MALTQDRASAQRDGVDVAVPVAAAAEIFAGSIVALDADGYAVPASDTAGLTVFGVAREHVDNSDGSDGDLDVIVTRGKDWLMKGSGLTQALVGQTVYVSDDETVTTAATATNDIPAGTLTQFDSATSGWVRIG